MDESTNVGVHTVCDIDPGEPANISVLLALDRNQAGPQSVCSNVVAKQNILDMPVTLDTSHFEMSPSNNSVSENISDMVVALFEMSPLNDVVHANILDMLVTLDTSHFERSPLNNFAASNIMDISFTLDTSQLEMSALNDLANANISDMVVT